ncbi:hypothetical protein [Streptomyces erythrochromogenes]|uniref:hypothetical protein n=1 Tax=Streptomyces erythrochromogenes TaxID=285574 RepID=UPI0036B609A0
MDADPAVRSTTPATGLPGPAGGARARRRTAPVLAAAAVVVAAAIGALAYTAGQHQKEPDPAYVSQDDNGESPSDDTASPTETPTETSPEPTDGGTTPEEPSPETTDPFDGCGSPRRTAETAIGTHWCRDRERFTGLQVVSVGWTPQ